MLDAQTLGQRLGEALAPTPSNAPQVCYGTIDTVNGDGTLDVVLYGTTLRGLVATTGCVGAAAGMRCVVLRQGPLATVVGLVANTDLADVHAVGMYCDELDVAGITQHHDVIYIDRGKPIFWKNSQDVNYQVLQINNSDQLVIGYGGYANQDIPTYVEGNAITLLSRGAVNVSSAGVSSNYAPTDWVYLVGSASGNRVRYCKRGGAVFVDVWYESSAGLSTTAKTLATLPAGFRPDIQVETAAFGNVDHLVMLRVNPGGSIVAKVMSGTTNYLKGIISFPV